MMAGISSKASGRLENRSKFNDGAELNTDLSLDWYETPFRGYDPQVGRFWQIDPVAEEFDSWSVYNFACNNPILLNDPTGLTAGFANDSLGRANILPDVIVRPSIKGKNASQKDFLYNTYASRNRQADGSLPISEKLDANTQRFLHDYHAIQERETEYDRAYGDAALFLATSAIPVGEALQGIAWLYKLQKGQQIIRVLGLVDDGALATKGGIETANGLKITGFTGHGVDRAIGSIGRSGVNPSAILDALKSPLKINNIVTDQLGRQSQRFIGQFGEAVVNPQTGKIISVNPTSSSKAAKLLKQLGQ